MINILLLPMDKIITLKTNLGELRQYYEHNNNDWIRDYFREQMPFTPSKYVTEDIPIEMGDQRPPETDILNVINVYERLKQITDSDASDERLWVGLAHSTFWEYMQYRWPPISTESILSHYFFSYSKRRSIGRHGISRLWWIGKLTYDEANKDKYALTETLCSNSDFISQYMGNNFTSNPNIGMGLLDCVIELKRSDHDFKREDFRRLVTYLNVLGGVALLDVFSRNEIKKILLKFADDNLTN